MSDPLTTKPQTNVVYSPMNSSTRELLGYVDKNGWPAVAIESSGPCIVVCLTIVIYLSLSALDTVFAVVTHGYYSTQLISKSYTGLCTIPC